MPKTARTYRDACRIAHALDLVGDRWSLLIVRELILGPKRFTDLSAGLPHATADMLTRRLRDLEEGAVIVKRRRGAPYGGSVYELTEWGRGLEPLVMGLGEWGARSPIEPRDPDGISPDSLLLAFRAHFVPDLADGPDIEAELRVGDATYRLAVAEGVLESGPGDAEDPDVTIRVDPPLALAGALWDGGSLDAAVDAGEVEIEGDVRAAKRLLAMFPPLEPVPAPR